MKSASHWLRVFAPAFAALVSCTAAVAQPTPQVPTLQACNLTQVKGSGVARIDRRIDASSKGIIAIKIDVKCDPAAGDGYPQIGALTLNFDLSDSAKGSLTATTIEQLTSTGKHTPTAWLSGRCKLEKIQGCRYWLMIADNHRVKDQGRTTDIVSVLVLDATGRRVVYGTGALVDGEIDVAPSPN